MIGKKHVLRKELIRLEKQAAEKRARLKNKLKWLGKEPRASFLFFPRSLFRKTKRSVGSTES